MRRIVVGGAAANRNQKRAGSWMRGIEGSDFRLQVNLTGY